MTQTVQPRSWACLYDAGKDLTLHKPDTEDNASLLLAVFDSLNNLHEKLCRLNFVMERKLIEYNLYQKSK